MKSYSLGEWKSILIPEILHSGDQSFLGQLQSSDRLEIDELKEGVRIRAKSWVGVIRFRDFQVQIVPKLAGENLGLIEMVEYCVGINALKRYSSQRYLSLKQQGNLFDLIALLFCDACEVILAGGVLFDYEQQEESIPSLRGRLLVDKQFQRRFGQLDRIECRFDEHSSNIVENQLLAFGLFKAGRLVQDAAIRNRTRRLSAIFSEVCQIDQLDLQAARDEILYNRINNHYKDAHNLAWMVIDGLGIDDLFKSDLTRSFAFLLDMNKLFEQFLHKYLLEILKKSNFSIAYQHRDQSIVWDLFRNRPYSQVIPDFIVSTEKSSRKMAIDAKYKLYDDRKVTSGDIAQIFLYAYAYYTSSQPTAVLIYPTEENSDEKASMIIRRTRQLNGAEIHVLGLHIPQALTEIREQNHGETARLIIDIITHNLTPSIGG